MVADASWNRLFEIALGQESHVTTRQDAEAGYSPQLPLKYLKNGRRVRRGVCRFVHFPALQHEDLAALWLWSEREGKFSHGTAFTLHELSDALPRQVHLTLAQSWAKQRLRLSEGVTLYNADIAKEYRDSVVAIPVTNAYRTLLDCLDVHVSSEVVDAAIAYACPRGLFDEDEAQNLFARVKRR